MSVAAQYVTNSVDAALWHAEHGGGLTLALSFQVVKAVRAGRLRIVLSEHESVPLPIQWMYPTSRLLSAKLRAFIDLRQQSLLATNMEFSLIAFIGILLLICIVKKNAIMMIDFAIHAQRDSGMDALAAITHACALRFRPIMMTTFAAIAGALPLALASGDGTEMRRPLGIAIVGGLVVSQVRTLYTTPVVFLYVERWREWSHRRRTAAEGVPSHAVA